MLLLGLLIWVLNYYNWVGGDVVGIVGKSICVNLIIIRFCFWSLYGGGRELILESFFLSIIFISWFMCIRIMSSM